MSIDPAVALLHAVGVEGHLDVDEAMAGIADVMKRGVAILAADGETGALLGSFGARPMPAAWYSSEMVLFETWFYVHPSARHRPSVMFRLLKAAKELADSTGWKLINALTTRDQIERKAKMYRGMTEIGRIFVYEPKGLTNGGMWW